jgi:hypothetical protein
MIGMLGSQSSYRDHMRPVWDALEPEERGCWAESQSGIGPASTWLDASQRDFTALRRFGVKRVHMEHGVGLQWYPARQVQQLQQADAIAAPNDWIADRFKERSRRLRVEVIGTPKMDLLVQDSRTVDRDSQTVAVALHWTGVLRQQSTSLDAWRPMIEELAGEREVLGHAHPKIRKVAERFYGELGIEFVPAFEDVCSRANLYLCDHGSTLYEWSALDREVVLLRRPGHQAQIPQASGLLWENHSGIGPELNLGGSLRAALEAAAEPSYREARQEASAALYPYIGTATQRAVDLLHEIEEGRPIAH